jgi:hypothetical protein
MAFSGACANSRVNLLRKSTTFLGLERVLRFALLSWLNSSDVPIDERLAPDAQTMETRGPQSMRWKP